jgi:hypothetical protein
MGNGSPRLQRHVVSAAAVLAASLALAPHAQADPGVVEQVAAVQAAPAPVVAQVVAAAEPVVAAAQPAAEQPVAAARPVVKTVAAAAKPHVAVVHPVLRSLPAVQRVSLPAIQRVVPAVRDVASTVHRLTPTVRPAVHAATKAVHTPPSARPQHLTSAVVLSPAHHLDRTARGSHLPDARLLVVRSEPAAPTAIAITSAKAVTDAHAAPQLTLTPLCQAQLSGTVSPGAAGGGAAAALPSHASHDPPLALVRLVAPVQAPRSHVLLLRIERPD